MGKLPRGTVTLLFTDIEGSTELLRRLGRESYVEALGAHRRILREVFARFGGAEVEMQGDSFLFAFSYARDAVAAAVETQGTLASHPWEREPIRVRMGLHTGEPVVTGEELYAGLDVHRAARVMSAAHGGQILLSARTTDLVDGELPEGLTVEQLGTYRLKDFERPESLAAVVLAGSVGGLSQPRAEVVAPHDATERTAHRGGPRLVIAATALVLMVAAAPVLFVLLHSHGSSGPVVNVVASIDTRRDAVVERVAVGNSPTEIAAGAGGVWVLNAADGTVSQLTPAGAPVRTIGTSGEPNDVIAAQGAVWVSDRPNKLLRIDPSTGNTTASIVLKASQTTFGSPVWMAEQPGALWVSVQDRLARVDFRTLAVAVRRLPTPDWGPIAASPDAIWESTENRLYRFNAEATTVEGSLAFPEGPLAIAAGFLWAINQSAGVAAQIDPTTDAVIRTTPVGSDPAGIAVGAGSVWVASQSGTVTRIDPTTGQVLATIRVGGSPQGLAVGFGRVWVAVS